MTGGEHKKSGRVKFPANGSTRKSGIRELSWLVGVIGMFRVPEAVPDAPAVGMCLDCARI